MKTERRSARIKRRVTCEFEVGGRRYRGIVLDLSETGLFVQTEATPGPGARLRLRFHATGNGEAFEVEGSVARRQVAPPQLAQVVRGGLGLRVHAPPPAYFELLGQSAAEAAEAGARAAMAARGIAPGRAPAGAGSAAPKAAGTTPAAPPEPPPGEPFRVRVKQSDGPRSRTLAVTARTPEDAAKKALADAGRGWEVLRVERG
jgi:hypothetical protein